MRIGPATCLPNDMVRSDVLLCLGEEWSEFTSAMDHAGLDAPGKTHRHRTFSAQVRDGVLCLAGGLSSAVVETSLWELSLAQNVERIILVGTAGALPGYRGAFGAPHLMEPARSVHQNFEPPHGWTGKPTWGLSLPKKEVISVDRFYGFSPATLSGYPAEPALREVWTKWKDHDALVDMEVAAFYWYAERFGVPTYAAIKAAANPLSDLDSLPEASHDVIRSVVTAGVDALLGG